jgi:hypothetical protein
MQASETYMITVACPCSQPANRIQTDAYLTNRKSREHAGALVTQSHGDSYILATARKRSGAVRGLTLPMAYLTGQHHRP